MLRQSGAGRPRHRDRRAGRKIAEGYEYLGEATNNVAELTGILRAAEIVPDGAAAVVHTDSQYAIGVGSTKGWKAKANVELIAGVKVALARRSGCASSTSPATRACR